ncbi:MAG: hypothetical protein FJ304_26575 [Planctomycetes bacterium]|nr:hypothetical protein [Planctomycetota bacterium]
MRAATLAFLLLAPPAPAQDSPPLKVPERVAIRAGGLGKLRAETPGKVVKWVALAPGLSIEPVEGGHLLYFAGLPGTYELLAYTATGDVPSESARVVVVIEGAPPAPGPPDELRAKLAAALARDRGARADVLQLAAIYREAARVAGEPDVPHSKELLARVRKVAEALLGPAALPAARAAVAAELLAVLGMSSEEPLTEARRGRAAALFARLAALLEELSK